MSERGKRGIRWHRTDSATDNDDSAAKTSNPAAPTPSRLSVFSGAQSLPSGTFGIASGIADDGADDAVAPDATQTVDYTNSLAVPPTAISADPTEPGSDITPQPGFGRAEPITPLEDSALGATGAGRHATEGGSLVASQPSSDRNYPAAPVAPVAPVNQTAPIPVLSDAEFGDGDFPTIAPAPQAAATPVPATSAPQAAAIASESLPLPHHLDLDSVEVPHIDVSSHFGERIEAMIAQAIIEAENTRADAKAQAKQIHDDAYADADRLIAAAKRQAAEIVTAAQERAHEQMVAAEEARAQAKVELDQAHQEAEEVRARAHEHADRVRSEGDAHVREIIARAHADTADQLHEARQELVDLSERKVELENQMAAIRSILEETALHTTEIPLVPFDGSFTPLAGGVSSEPFAGWEEFLPTGDGNY